MSATSLLIASDAESIGPLPCLLRSHPTDAGAGADDLNNEQGGDERLNILHTAISSILLG